MAAKYLHYTYDQLNTFCMDAFQKFGFSESEARIISDVLLLSDLYGIESHGMQRLVRYHKGIEKGMIDVHAKPEIVHETPVSAVIDAHDAMGQLVSHQAMELAIEKAKKTGMAIVSVRNSNHFGIAGYYAKMACDQGLVGMAMTNSEAIMVPTYARMAMIGSNPIALAVPAEPYPFFFDASTTVVTRGKLEVYNKMGKPLPEGLGAGQGRPSLQRCQGRAEEYRRQERRRHHAAGRQYRNAGQSQGLRLRYAVRNFLLGVLSGYAFQPCERGWQERHLPWLHGGGSRRLRRSLRPSRSISPPICRSCATRPRPTARPASTPTARRKFWPTRTA